MDRQMDGQTMDEQTENGHLCLTMLQVMATKVGIEGK